jgi:hypothetical protein
MKNGRLGILVAAGLLTGCTYEYATPQEAGSPRQFLKLGMKQQDGVCLNGGSEYCDDRYIQPAKTSDTAVSTGNYVSGGIVGSSQNPAVVTGGDNRVTKIVNIAPSSNMPNAVVSGQVRLDQYQWVRGEVTSPVPLVNQTYSGPMRIYTGTAPNAIIGTLTISGFSVR